MPIHDLHKYIISACNNDPEALEMLYKLTYKRIYYLTLSMMECAEDAQDAVQETYIKAFSHLSELKNPLAFNKWLLKIAVNTCKNFTQKNKLKIVDIAEDEFSEQIISEESYFIDDNLDKSEIQTIIMNIIDNLPADQKRAVLLYYYEQLTAAQIAELEECTVSTITSRLLYARAAIKKSVIAYEEKKHIKLHAKSFLPSIGITLTAAASLSVSPVTATVIFIAVMKALGFAAGTDGPVLIMPLDDHNEHYDKNGFIHKIKSFFGSQLIFHTKMPVILALILILTSVFIITAVKTLNHTAPVSEKIKPVGNIIKTVDLTSDHTISAGLTHTQMSGITVSDFTGLQNAIINGGVIVIDGEIGVTETLTVTSDVTLTGGTLYRAYEKDSTFFRDTVLYVSGSEVKRVSLTLNSVVIDGRCYDAESDRYKETGMLLIAADGYTDVILNGAQLMNNDCAYTGGVSSFGSAATVTNNSTIHITGNTIIENNRSQSDAGAVGLEKNSTLTMDSGIIRNNTAYNHGGAILAYESKVYLNGGEISNNHANNCGGGVILVESELYITGGSCLHNSAEQNGGGVYIMSSHADISGYTCTGNYAVNDGGIYIYQSDVSIKNCTVTDNITERTGGGIAAFYSEIEADGLTINGNESVSGGGVFVKKTTAVFQNCDIYENNSLYSGGGIFTESGELTLLDVTVKDNKAAKSGNGIYLTNRTNFFIRDDFITDINTIGNGDDISGDKGYEKYIHFIK